LDGTVAVVTGASSGIGEATARALAARGARVALLARRADRLATLVSTIQQDGGEALAITADLTDQQQAQEAIEATVHAYGRLDTLVNNAGVMLLGPAQQAPLAEWERMVRINLLGVLYGSHAALPHLLRAAEDSPRGVADMVNVSSVAGRVARSGNSVYSATKHALGAFTESLRQEFTQRHLRVGVIEPGAVETELASHNRPEVQASFQSVVGTIERLVAEDIADAIVYMVTRPRRVAVNELLIRPTEQAR
jgi:NADP-dependent 3-hydroxy acid dehydrogenase YdfG